MQMQLVLLEVQGFVLRWHALGVTVPLLVRQCLELFCFYGRLAAPRGFF
jgi:hypothetical protein